METVKNAGYPASVLLKAATGMWLAILRQTCFIKDFRRCPLCLNTGFSLTISPQAFWRCRHCRQGNGLDLMMRKNHWSEREAQRQLYDLVFPRLPPHVRQRLKDYFHV